MGSTTVDSNICRWLFRGKMHSDRFQVVEIFQGRWQHGEEVGYWYPNRLDRAICKWDIHVPLVTKGLISVSKQLSLLDNKVMSQ